MSKKAVFFDIDGTLWDYEQKIPESLATALEKLRMAGNLAFICTGRARSTVYEQSLLDLGFDGILAGCGTYVEMKDEVLYEHTIEFEELKSLCAMLKEKGIGIFAEGSKKLFIDWDYFNGQAYAEGFRSSMGETCVGLDTLTEEDKVNKLSVDFLGMEPEVVTELIDAEKYDVIIHDMSNQGEESRHVAEIIPKGFSKATGMEWICKHLEIDWKNTYAFGDGSNDIAMLKAANCGICMGNGNEIAKEQADVITEAVMDNGVYKELLRQGLYIRM